MAKENDDILGGDNIAQLLVYTASARAKAQAIHAAIAATKNLDEAVTLRADSIATEQAYARVSIFGDQRIGELLRELPTRQGKRTDITSSQTREEVTKSEALHDAGISRSEAYRLEDLAENPAIVEAVIAKAEAEGRLVSRKQATDAINEKKRAEQQRDEALDELEEAYHMMEMSENTVRRNFTGSELAEGIRRQMAIEAEKAKERMESGGVQIFAQGTTGKARDKAAERFGISGEQARKTLYVANNADMLDPADRSAVIDYMYENQTGRRNLTPGQKSTLEIDVSEAKLREEARSKQLSTLKQNAGQHRSDQLVGTDPEQGSQPEPTDDSDTDPQVVNLSTSPPDKKRENETAYRLAKRAGVGVGTMKRTMEVKKSGDHGPYTHTA